MSETLVMHFRWKKLMGKNQLLLQALVAKGFLVGIAFVFHKSWTWSMHMPRRSPGRGRYVAPGHRHHGGMWEALESFFPIFFLFSMQNIHFYLRQDDDYDTATTGHHHYYQLCKHQRSCWVPVIEHSQQALYHHSGQPTSHRALTTGAIPSPWSAYQP